MLIALCVFGVGWEAYWRAHWFEPNDYTDSPVLWRWQRQLAKGNSTVLVGSSRIFEDVNLDTWQRLTGSRPIQLAIVGQNPTPVIHDLAEDTDFRGVVVAEVTPYLFFMHPTDVAERMIKGARRAGPGERVDQDMSDFVERHLAFVDDDTKLTNLWRRVSSPLRPGQFPVRDVPKGNIMREDRSAAMWRRLEDDARYQAHYRWLWMTYAGSGGPPPGMAEAVARVSEQIAKDVAQIRRRGGDVIFVRFPSAGPLNASEESSMGRASTWAPLLKATGAPGIHFRDYPELARFSPPEWSHLSSAQAVGFTAALVPIVAAKLGADERVARVRRNR